MSLFRRGKFVISERDPTYKVRYLGNVQTALMKGDGCVDKATGVLWNNFSKSNGTVGIDMKLTICATGLKAMTKEQGLTEYRAHRISYCIAHPKYPKLFVWVYRHEGKRMKVELRCHAVLCKTEAKAKAMAVQLHEKVTCSLQEFMREKTRRQNVRLTLQRTNSMPMNSSGISGVPLRKKFLCQGGNFKPPIERSPSAPKLGDITEDHEGEEEERKQMFDTLHEIDEEEDVDEEEEELVIKEIPEADSCSTDTDPDSPAFVNGASNSDPGTDPADLDELASNMFALEVGNDIDELKQDEDVCFQLRMESDDTSSDKSSESGFSEKDPGDSGLSNGSSSNHMPSTSPNATVMAPACSDSSKVIMSSVPKNVLVNGDVVRRANEDTQHANNNNNAEEYINEETMVNAL